VKKSSRAFAVIGLGFGDEGKGVSVNSLCKQYRNSLVVRYSGGQQAGHTVVDRGISHVFSNFGSGTLRGKPTFWSKYCTFDPVGVVNEYMVLKQKGVIPVLYIDAKSPVTTPYDKVFNQTSNKTLNNGSCGVGVGATYKREENFHSLLVGDLEYKSVFLTKLNLIAKHYGLEADTKYFLECVEFILKHANFQIVNHIPMMYDTFVFEGSQGLLLDQNIGFYPHVTPSNVGTKNILEMGFEPHIVMVTRAFQTRHGNGPMTNTNLGFVPKNDPRETNVLNQYQGEFKKSMLDLDLLRYGISRDDFLRNHSKDLVITCLDLVENNYSYTLNGNVINHSDEDSFVRGIGENLGVLGAHFIHRIRSPDGTFKLDGEVHGYY
jgi:adenylosuccinate synthase